MKIRLHICNTFLMSEFLRYNGISGIKGKISAGQMVAAIVIIN